MVEMPAYSLPFPVRVSCEIDLRRIFRFFSDAAQDIAATADRNLLHIKIMIYIHAKLTLWKITDMSL